MLMNSSVAPVTSTTAEFLNCWLDWWGGNRHRHSMWDCFVFFKWHLQKCAFNIMHHGIMAHSVGFEHAAVMAATFSSRHFNGSLQEWWWEMSMAVRGGRMTSNFNGTNPLKVPEGGADVLPRSWADPSTSWNLSRTSLGTPNGGSLGTVQMRSGTLARGLRDRVSSCWAESQIVLTCSAWHLKIQEVEIDLPWIKFGESLHISSNVCWWLGALRTLPPSRSRVALIRWEMWPYKETGIKEKRA